MIVQYQGEHEKQKPLEYIQNKENAEEEKELNITHSCVMLYEIRSNGFPDKRRRLSHETRQIIRFLKHFMTSKAASDPQYDISNKYAINHLTSKPFFRLKKGSSISDLFIKTNDFAQTLFKDVVRLNSRPIHGLLASIGEFQALSSCLPVKALQSAIAYKSCQKIQNGIIIDLCAAPGSKTLQASDCFVGVLANELNKSRFKSLEKRAAGYLSNKSEQNIQCVNMDAFTLLDCLCDIYKGKTINWNEKAYQQQYISLNNALCQLNFNDKQNLPQIEAILLDPSCSGSGMLQTDKELAKLAQGENQKQQEQNTIEKLGQFQEQLLTKTILTAQKLKIPFVSYSTCSIHSRENEIVVQNVLSNLQNVKLINSLPEWSCRNNILPECCIGNIQDHGCGFFLAVFDLQ